MKVDKELLETLKEFQFWKMAAGLTTRSPIIYLWLPDDDTPLATYCGVACVPRVGDVWSVPDKGYFEILKVIHQIEEPGEFTHDIDLVVAVAPNPFAVEEVDIGF